MKCVTAALTKPRSSRPTCWRSRAGPPATTNIRSAMSSPACCPLRLRRRRSLPATTRTIWYASAAGLAALPTLGARAARQRDYWHGWHKARSRTPPSVPGPPRSGGITPAREPGLGRGPGRGHTGATTTSARPRANAQCRPGAAVDALDAAHAMFHTFVLTGSRAAARPRCTWRQSRAAARGGQALVLVPKSR